MIIESSNKDSLEKLHAYFKDMSDTCFELKKKRVLILEDEDLGQRTFKNVLSSIENKSVEFDLVSSVEEALDKIHSTNYDFFILDIRIKTSEFNNDSGLRLVELHPNIADRTIIWSGYLTGDIRKRAGRLGIPKVLDKTAQIIEDLCCIVENFKGANLKNQLMKLCNG